MPSIPRVLACAAVLALAVAEKAAAQTAAAVVPSSQAAGTAKDPYADEAVVVERLDSIYQYNADGTGTKLDTDVARLQTDAAVRAFGVLSVPYAAGTQKLELVYVRVRKANGTLVSTPAADAQDQAAPVTQVAPFYSDLHLLQIPIRGMAVGDRLEYQVRTVLTKPEAEGQFWGAESFGTGVVVLERSLELRVPKGKYVQVWSPKYPAKVSDEGGETVYRWAGSQPKPTPKPTAKTDGENKSAAASEGKEDKLPPVAWTTFHSWAEVGEWYRGLAADRSAVTPAMKAKADELVAGLTTPEAKIQALYAYVSANVRYIGVAFGIGRYQPHTAGEVLANQYGDCKDKHTLLAALLQAEGLPASAVLIGAGVEMNEAVPSPGAFNHLITLTSDPQHGDAWLDATPEVAPYRMLEAPLRDKEALVIPAKGEPALRKTPAEPPFPVFTKFEAAGTLSATGEMKAHVDLTMRGDEELLYRAVLRNVTPGQWDRVTQFYARSAGFAGDPSNTIADAPEKTDRPLHVAYDYNRSPYGDWDSFRIIPLQPWMNLPMNEEKTAPTGDIELGGPRTDTAVSRITLPAGYGAELPASVHLRTDFATLDKTYRLEKSGDAQVLVTERTLAFKEAKLPGSQWGAYRKFLDDVGTDEPWVQLTSTDAKGTAGKHPPMAGETNTVAEELVRQANQSTLENDWTTATRKLDEAKSINPKQAYLWSNYGYIAERAGKPAEAAEDYRKELKEHPEESFVSQRLANVLAREGKGPDAEAALRDAVALNPHDEEAVMMLSNLQGRTDLGGAEKTLRAGLTNVPESLTLKLALGGTLMREGKREEAGSLLTEVAAKSTDAGQLNDAAYMLADGSLALPVAEAAARRAVQLLNEQTARGESGVASTQALRRNILLVATWDTYGWVLYREGNVSEAETWLRAAWMNGFDAESGLHLGMAYEKQGRAAEAAKVYNMAEGGERGPNADAVLKSLHEHEAAVHAGARGTDGRMALQKERTFSVPRGGVSATGWAVFELEYAYGRPVVARFVHGEQKLEGIGPALSKADLRTILPPGSSAHLLRRGLLNCHAGPTCIFVVSPALAALTQ